MAITAHENMTMIAVGFKNGTVLLIRGNIARDRQSRQRVVHEEKEPGVYVSGKRVALHFNLLPTSSLAQPLPRSTGNHSYPPSYPPTLLAWLWFYSSLCRAHDNSQSQDIFRSILAFVRSFFAYVWSKLYWKVYSVVDGQCKCPDIVASLL